MTSNVTPQKFLDAGLPGYDTLTTKTRNIVIMLVIIEIILSAFAINAVAFQDYSIPPWMNIVGYIMQGILVFAFLMSGIGKIKGKMGAVDFSLSVEYWKLPPVSRSIIGFSEFLTAILLLLGFFFSQITVFGGLILLVIMMGAIMTHLFIVRDSVWMPSFVLFSLGLIVVILNSTSLM